MDEAGCGEELLQFLGRVLVVEVGFAHADIVEDNDGDVRTFIR
jgi:hypothetical protein